MLFEVCKGCGWEVDMACCWCGDPHKVPQIDPYHDFVPIGCTCYFADAEKRRNPQCKPS